MIDKSQIGPIIDFINYQKFDSHETYENGVITQHPPPQPNFSLTNRNPNTLLNLVHHWHQSTSQVNLGDLIRFEVSPIKPYGKINNKACKSSRHTITQITNNYELFKEGEELGHCVGSYVSSCRKNHCTIWSLSQHEAHQSKKLITIEVDQYKEIVEARGKFNRYPTGNELMVIREWARQEHLAISDWID